MLLPVHFITTKELFHQIFHSQKKKKYASASQGRGNEKKRRGQQELFSPAGPILDMCWFLKFGKLDDSVGRSGNGCTLQVPPDPRSPGVAIAFEEDDSWAGAAAAAVVTIV